jgi:flagellin
MTVINTNVGALQARTYAVRADSEVTKAMERLSSGLRINSAADDAAGLAVANKMESQVRGMNMAIRNSQDGISLVQTAEAAMGEINNMVIRMRELAVQMNNGVYTDADRSNAQLEVTALLQEIDKVADNSAFNQVKILDGTYSQDIRAGNTNPEVINVTIDRMNTDTLGGGRVTTGDVDATNTSSTFKTSNTTIEATEGRVTFGTGNMGTAMQAHATANAGGTWSIASSSADSSALFEINATSGAVTLNSATPVAELNFDSATPANNTYTFAIQYSQGGTTVTDNITLNITDKAVATSAASGTAELTVEEGDCIKIYSVDTTDGGVAQTGIFSDQFKEFVAANAGSVTFAEAAHSDGTDDTGDITLNTATGAILANLDFERASDSNTDNVYKFAITATAGTVTVTENVTLTVTDDHAGQTTNANVTTMTAAQITAAADGAVLNTNDADYTAADTVAYDGTVTATLDGDGGGTLDLTWANLDGNITGGTDTITAWLTEHPSTGANHTVTVVSDGGTGGDVTATAAAAGISIDEALAAGTYEDVQISIASGDGEIFHLEFDLVVTDTGTSALTAASTSLASTGTHSQLTILGGGEAMNVDLKVGTSGSTTDAHFDKIGDAYVADPCGTFEIVANTQQFNNDDAHANRTNLSVSADGVLTLAAGAAAGTYSALVKYTDNDGEATFERIDIISTDVGEDGGNDIATATALTAAAATRQSTEQIAGTSILAVDEARQGNITSTGTGAVLSAAFNTFATSYTGGTYSVSGTDSALFNIDAATGAIETKGLVDFETKTSYSMTVTYTSGNNTYSEDVTLNVTNNTVDDGSHISNVNLGTQAGSATAVGILDTAINQITESQAKLGAIQNRLQYNIDNLSKASMLTTTAKGRIMDADFASETSELSKQQILSQAATSMLAQANQSKQSVLALLQ